MKKNSLIRGWVIGFSFIAICSIFSACRKNIVEKRPDDTKAYFPQTPEEKKLVERIKRIESVMEVIYADRDVRREINAAILARPYREEMVRVSDLLYTESSKLYSLDRFQKFNVKTGVFSARFREEYQKQFGSSTTTQARGPYADPDYYEVNGITIYWPYSEDFPDIDMVPDDEITLVAADRNANEGPGREPVKGSGAGGRIIYNNVTVNDNYAMRHATHIIGVTDRQAVIEQPNDPPPPPGPQINRVYHGWSRLSAQLDNLIGIDGNGGGSEMKVCRISGYLQFVDQQVVNFTGDLVTINYSRKDISRQVWKRVYSVWDPDWKTDNLQQAYAVYEEDTKGTKTYTGSLNTTLRIGRDSSLIGATVNGTVGYSITVQTQDEIVTQRTMDRYSYFRDALNDQGWGFLPDPNDFLPPNVDWPKYDQGTIWSYTWPYRVF